MHLTRSALVSNLLRTLLLIGLLLLAGIIGPRQPQTHAQIQTAPVAVKQSRVVHPDWSYNATIYEVNLRQYTPGGTFVEFERHLPRLKEMGVGILWLMPIHPIGEQHRKGTLGSYYSVQDYLAVNPEFGTLEDFRRLVQSIHEQGMYVIIDWVANHTAWDNPLLKEHPDWYTKDDSGRFVSPVADWSDVVDLNYEAPGLWEYMINAMRYWVEDTDIDGFRCDVAGMVPFEFWEAARANLEDVKPVFMLAEDEAPQHHAAAFDMTYSWSLHRLMIDIVQGKKNANDLMAYFVRDARLYPADAFRMRFTDNHDENSWNGTVQKRLGPAVETFAVLTATAPGMPLVYSGQETGLDRSLEFFEKDLIHWRDHPLGDFYTRLLNLKQEHEALWNGARGSGLLRVTTDSDSAVFAFLRATDRDKIFVLLNLSGEAQDATLTGVEPMGEYVDLFTEEVLPLPVSASVELEPWGYRVLIGR